MHPISTLRTTAFAAALVLAAQPAIAQEAVQVSGTVTSQTSGERLAGVFVSVEETGDSALTDENGAYTLSLPPGTYTLRAELGGYEVAKSTVTVAAGVAATTNIVLPDDPRFSEVIVVVGSRTERSNLETPVPIDIIDEEVISESGHTEVNQVMATVAPSFNATRQTIADGTDHIDPASLRGLGPDQVLVLLNGKRRHSSALLNVNGTFGRGTVGTDLNAIPSCAIQRIEVLRDGAASQYGSDAIAGVININLKETHGVLDFRTQTGITAEGDGGQVKSCANYGVKIGDNGFFNLTGEFLVREKTQRAGLYTGDIFPGITGTEATDAELARLGLTREDYTMAIGQGGAVVGMLFYNSEVPLTSNATAYSFGGFTARKGYASGFFRFPNQLKDNVPEIFPLGFLPEINPRVFDWSASGGVRGKVGSFLWDASVTHGGSSFQFIIDNTVNASLGPASPTSFDAGRLQFYQTVANADFVAPIKLAFVNSLAFVFGGEGRFENYQITEGERGSYILGPETYIDPADGVEKPKQSGAQVFPGFQPENAVDEGRNSQSVYAGFESKIAERVNFDLGGRFENYSDFGSTVIGKAAARVEVVENTAVRGAVSTGFRAPSLHQVWFSNVSTQFVGTPLEARQVLTAANKGPQGEIARAFGIPELKEETSLSLSAGITTRPLKNLSLSADAYQIKIDDRIVFTGQFADSDPTVNTLLDMFPEFNASRVQFFTNAVDTTTRGLDIVIDYGMPLSKGQLDLSASANITETTVDKINIPAGLAQVFPAESLEGVETIIFNREERNRLEDALPQQKGTFSVRYGLNNVSALLRANYYGKVYYRALPLPPMADGTPQPTPDEEFGARVIFDADLGYQYKSWKLSIGANNLLNTYPDKQKLPVNISAGRFLYSRRVSQFGVNGGFYYLRLQYLL